MHTKDDGPHLTHDELVAMGYDRRDVNLKTIRRAIVIFFIFAALCWAAAYLYLRFFGAGYTEDQLPNAGRPRKVPALPNPLLQNNITAKADMMEYRQAEEKALAGYSYADAQKTKVIIPIELAKEQLLQRGVAIGGSIPAVSRPVVSGQTTGGKPILDSTDNPAPAGANAGQVPANDPLKTAPNPPR